MLSLCHFNQILVPDIIDLRVKISTAGGVVEVRIGVNCQDKLLLPLSEGLGISDLVFLQGIVDFW